MDVELLQQADVILSKCGRPTYKGASAVPIYKAFLVPMVLQPGGTITYTKEITGETTWALRAISSSVGSSNAATGVRLQIQLPNGRYMFGGKNGIDAGQFTWVGSWRHLQDPEMDCEPGSKIRVTLSDTGTLAAALAVNLLFEGAYKFYLKGGGNGGMDLASTLPRYQGIVNENILAPSSIAGVGPSTPPGYEDEAFTYSSDTATITIASTAITATLKIGIDAGTDFVCRRLLFDIQADATVTAASFLGRVRAGSGYALCDSYMDLARYIGGAETPKDWIVRGGDEVFIDLALADATGTGNVSMTVHLEGARRRKL